MHRCRTRTLARSRPGRTGSAPLFALSLIGLLVAAPAARADVLVVGAPGTDAWLADVQSKIAGTGVLTGSVDTFDAKTGTPSLAQLLTYDAVLFFGDASFQDQDLLGDNLADYVDLGGGVVESTFALQGSGGLAAGGRWRSDGYDPLLPGPQDMGTPLTLGTVHVAGHPILAGVSGFSGGSSSFHNIVGGVSSGTLLVADWSNGRPLVAANTSSFAGRTAALNFFPPSSDASSPFWDASSDGALLMANALAFVVPEPGTALLLGAGLLAIAWRRRA